MTEPDIKLSQAAADELRRIMSREGLDEDSQWLRIVVKRTGRSIDYGLELASSIDANEITLVCRGVRVACRREQVPAIAGAAIDYRMHDGLGPDFVVEFPEPADAGDDASPPTESQIYAALKNVFDPEVGVNIVDLGLVYSLAIDERDVRVTMTMTTPACPLSESIQADVKRQIRRVVPGTGTIDVEIVWDPPWSPEQISVEGRRQLGWL